MVEIGYAPVRRRPAQAALEQAGGGEDMAEARDVRPRRVHCMTIVAVTLCLLGISPNTIEADSNSSSANGTPRVGSLSYGYGGGRGTAADPCLIFTAEHLHALGTEPADWAKHFRQAADIDLSDYAKGRLQNIGVDEASPFSGVFDGNDHTIRGLNRRNPPDSGRSPLFGYVTGTVRHVGLIDPNVGGQLLYYTGALVADNHGTLENCYVEDANVAGGGWYAGGLVGRNEGKIIRCHSAGLIRDRSAGGLVGMNRGTIADCHSAATVLADTVAGGLVAENWSGTLTNCAATGTVTGDDRTGGLVGYNSNAAITCCYSTAIVVGNDDVGGLVGANWQGVITNCYSAANVTGDRQTGGLVGNNGSGIITNCYATGPVSGRYPAGGLVAFRYGDDIVTASFWDMDTTGCPWSAADTGLTTAQMQTAAPFLAAGWDFANETANGGEDLWRIVEGESHPRLFWESSEADNEEPPKN